MGQAYSLWYFIFGNTNTISTERYFVTITAFTIGMSSLILGIFHILYEPVTNLSVLSICFALVCFILYYMVRFHGGLLIPKTIITIGFLILLDFAWYSNYLSDGPVLMAITIFAGVIVMLWKGKQQSILLVFYFLNAFVLFYIELNVSETQRFYVNHSARTTYIYFSLFLHTLVYVFLLYVYKTEFRRQRERAINSDKLKSAFLANMSHEIRTPMNGILGFSDLLKNPYLSDKTQKQYIEVIEKSGLRMLNVLNDIIDISKIEAGLISIDVKELDVKNELNYIHDFFTPEATKKGLNLIYNNPRPLEEVKMYTDREKFYSIFTNLVKNAIKYTDKGTVEIGYEIHEGHFLFYVKDTGMGIAKGRQNAIFERFVQADIDDVQARQGSGLGLAISKSYVTLLGGKIWLESDLGKGTVFKFTLPKNYKA